MHLIFKSILLKSWELTDDRIILDGRVILLSEIQSVKWASEGSRVTNGVIDIKVDNKVINLPYSFKYLEDGRKAYEYIKANYVIGLV